MTLRTQLQEDTTYRVLRMLLANPDLTQQLGISTSGLSYSLRALIYKGWVKVQNSATPKQVWLHHRADLEGRC